MKVLCPTTPGQDVTVGSVTSDDKVVVDTSKVLVDVAEAVVVISDEVVDVDEHSMS